MCRQSAFTLVELLVALVIVSLLLTVAVPRYSASVDRAKEAVLKENLAVTRDAIDKFFADKGRYPESLEELVEARYLRRVPVDPIQERSDGWTLHSREASSGFDDLGSSAAGIARDGTAFRDW